MENNGVELIVKKRNKVLTYFEITFCCCTYDQSEGSMIKIPCDKETECYPEMTH